MAKETNVIMPQMGESIYEGTITRWRKKVGEVVKRDEILYEISTDKVDTEIPSPVGGILLKIVVEEGKKVPIQTVVAVIDEEGGTKAVPAEPQPAVAAAPPRRPSETAANDPIGKTSMPEPSMPKGDGERVFASPLVKRIAREERIDLSQIPGSGLHGRVTKEDIVRYLEARKQADQAVDRLARRVEPESIPQASPLAPAPAAPKSEVVPMTPMRAKIAEHMLLSRRTSAHVTTVFEVDLSRIVALREKEKEDFERIYGTKLTYTPFFAYAAVQSIRDFPIINSSVDANTIVYKRFINLGIAVALPEGLIVPVVRNAEEKSFLGLTRAVNDLAERARTKRLTVDDVQGGTFTITNPGIYGGLFGTPIIHQPQVAIMGLGGIQKRPVVVDDAIAIRSMCCTVLSFDHRVIDGAVADQFMASLKKFLQEWTVPIR